MTTTIQPTTSTGEDSDLSVAGDDGAIRLPLAVTMFQRDRPVLPVDKYGQPIVDVDEATTDLKTLVGWFGSPSTSQVAVVTDTGFTVVPDDVTMDTADSWLKAQYSKPKLLRVRDVATWMNNPPPVIKPLVSDLILPGDRVIIGAPRGFQKSHLVMGLALQFAFGDGLVFGRFRVEHAARVLFSHGELTDDRTTWERWQKLLADGELPPGMLLETFDPWKIRLTRKRRYEDDGSVDWQEARVDDAVKRTMETYEPEVFIPDPWITFDTANENDSAEREATLGKMAELQARYGITLITPHHLRKDRNAADPEDLWRGSSRLADWASVRITMLPNPPKGVEGIEARRYAQVHFLLRRQPTPEPIDVKFNYETLQWEPWTPPGGGKHDVKTDADNVLAKAREVGRFKSTSQAAELCGVSRDTVAKVLNELVQQGKMTVEDGERNAKVWTPRPVD